MFTAVQARCRQTVVNLNSEQTNEALCKVLCHNLCVLGQAMQELRLFRLTRYRRLKVRYEQRADVLQAFLELGCALTFWDYMQRSY